MVPERNNRRLFSIIALIAAVLLTVVVLLSYAFSDDPSPQKVTPITTTTTLPKKNAQACEYLKDEALIAGGITPDVSPFSSDGLKRCTYEDIGGEVNYITLYVDAPAQCETLSEALENTSKLPALSASAIYSDDMDPTIVELLGGRCYFLQGAKTLVTKASLTAVAQSIHSLFTAVDSSTTTTTPSNSQVSSSTTALPGVNTAPSSTAKTTTSGGE